MNETPSSAQFATALKNVRISKLQRKMINVHYQAPDHTLTALQMANALGYPHYSVSNGNYGKLGRLVGNNLDWTPPCDSDLGVAVLCNFAKAKDHWLWIMRPEVVEAVERLGWVDLTTVILPEEVDVSSTYAEGAIRQVSVNAYERNPTARISQ
jgi:putative restriction endonuclease